MLLFVSFTQANETKISEKIDTLLILGDSLSAGYQMTSSESWPILLQQKYQKDNRFTKIAIVNASFSGDTSQQGLARLPALLKKHKPRWVLIELGANDGLRGFPINIIQQTIERIIIVIKEKGAIPIVMQIKLPPNYGRRYSEDFAKIFQTLSNQYATPYFSFFLEKIILDSQFMLPDGVHPNAKAQPLIAEDIAQQLEPYLLHTDKHCTSQCN